MAAAVVEANSVLETSVLVGDELLTDVVVVVV
jgi:predicted HAD superfamily phosphohydrolase YqeG